MTDPTHSSRGELTPGTPVLGRCVVEHFVRRGPLASVYTARPRSGGGEAYMLRVVHGDLVTWSERGAAAFTREIERVKSLKHPSIPRVVAYDCAASGPLLLTAQTGGSSLRELMIRNERPSPGELAKIIAAIAAALDAMHHHSAPIMHRAVSPENIVVSERGRWIEEAGLVQAVVAGDLVPDRASYFSFPGYQAPEEFSRAADPRGDAFSLALVAFEALTGRPAFESLGPSALSALIQVGQLPRATEFCPELPSTVDTVFERAWSLTPGDGYVGPVAFSVDFTAVIESLGAHANRVLVPSGLVPSSLPPPLNENSSPEVHIAPAPAVPAVGPLERSARPTLRMGSGAVPQRFSPTTIPRLPGLPVSDELTPVILNPLIPPAAYGPSVAERPAPVVDPLLQPPISGERPVVPNANATAPVPVSALPQGPHDPPPTFQPRQSVPMNAQSVDPLISLPSLDGPASSPGFEFAEVARPRSSRTSAEPRATEPEPEVSSSEIDSALLEPSAPEPLPPPPAPLAPVRTPPPPLPRASERGRPEAPSAKAPPRSPAPPRAPSSQPPALVSETPSKPFWRPGDATILAASRALSLSTVIAAVVATIGLVQASRTLDALSSEPVVPSVDPPTAPAPPPPRPVAEPPPPPPPAEVTDVPTVPSVMVFDAGPPATNVGPVAVGPSPDQIPSDAARRAVFARLRPLVSDCVEGLDPERFPVRVRYTGSTGAVEAIHLRGIFADAPIGPCIEEAVRSVRMPSFPAPQWEYTYMFTVPPPR